MNTTEVQFKRSVRSILNGAGRVTPELVKFATEHAQKKTHCSDDERKRWGKNLTGKDIAHSPFV